MGWSRRRSRRRKGAVMEMERGHSGEAASAAVPTLVAGQREKRGEWKRGDAK